MRLHAFIEARRKEIVVACLGKLRETYKVESDGDLLDGIPGFLEELVGALRRVAGADAAETQSQTDARTETEAFTAVGHATDRHRRGAEVTRVIHDYGVVCDKINDLASREGLEFVARDTQVMNVVIDKAIATGVEAFFAISNTAEQRDRAEQFGALAHEVRNAANAASMAFSLISRGKVAADGRTAQVLRRALSRIESLVGNAMIEAQFRANAPLQRERIRVADLVAEVVDLIFPERGVRIEVEVDPGLYVDGDFRLLTSVVSNLVQNAAKFTLDQGTIVVRGDERRGAVVIEVEDRCGGLPDGLAEELFEPFVKKGGRTRGAGAGLGLHVVRAAVVAHGGRVAVRNAPGVGCIFTVSLPVSAAPGAKAA